MTRSRTYWASSPRRSTKGLPALVHLELLQMPFKAVLDGVLAQCAPPCHNHEWGGEPATGRVCSGAWLTQTVSSASALSG